MKIAVASSGNTLDSKVDSRFGRCAYFAIHDTETKETIFLENPSKDVDGGAGPKAVQFIANQQANKIVSGEFGMKIKSLLEELGIQMIAIKEEKTIQNIIDLQNN
ncbi:MAG: NifB/NifX family molybdenum-iron cluster-binding protein [Bacteroidetes bacterium]|nr:NifB/NifX family molybdenum-iron cluster-binding protein [Bacteroidota bacterium]